MRSRRFLAATLACLTLLGATGVLGLSTACGGGGGSTPAAPAAPTISGFTAAKSPLTAGTSTTLSAVFANGTGILTPGAIAITSGTPVTVAPATTTTYTLTVTNSASQSLSQTLTVVVVPPPAIASFSPAALGIVAGASTTLTPTFVDGTGSIDQGIGAVTSGTPITVSPTSATTYTLTVTNAAGSAVTAQAAVGLILNPTGASLAISAGSLVTSGKAGCVASTQDFGPTTGYVWTLSNGIITAGQGTPAITYTPGRKGSLVLSVVATNALGGAGASVLATVLPGLQPGTIFAQNKVHLDAHSAKASVMPGPGDTIAWTLSAGSINGRSDQELLDYQPPAVTGPITLTATLTNPVGDSVTQTHTVQVVSGEFLRDPRVGMWGGYGWTPSNSGPILDFNTQMYGYDWDALDPLKEYKHFFYHFECEVIDPLSLTIKRVADLPNRDYEWSNNVVPLPDGRVLVGATAMGYDANFFEYYEPATETWSPAPDFPVDLYYTGIDPALWAPVTLPKAVGLGDGRVLFVGGGLVDRATWSIPLYNRNCFILDTAAGTWSQAGSLRHGRDASSGYFWMGWPSQLLALPDGRVFVAGNQGDTFNWAGGSPPVPGVGEIYDPVADTWTDTAPALFPRNDLYYGSFAGYSLDWTMLWAGTVLSDGRVLLRGKLASANGYPAPPDPLFHQGYLALYDPAANTWRFRHNDIPPIWNNALPMASLPGGKALLSGLHSFPYTDPTTAATVEWPAEPFTIYDPATDAHTPTAEPWPGWGAGGYTDLQDGFFVVTLNNLADGKVAVVGGTEANGTSCMTYDPAVDRWALKGDLFQALISPTATVLSDGRVLYAGGTDNQSQSEEAPSGPLHATVYDAAQGWILTPKMLKARAYMEAALLPDGTVLATGGMDEHAVATDTTERYDPAANTWTAAPAMTTPRFKHTLTALSDGRLLAVGGSNAQAYLASAELYDPASGTWTTVAPMRIARQNHTATLLPDGRVLVVGGSDRLYTFGTAEVYDPATNRWTATGPLLHPRTLHRATLLQNGKVLVSGGWAGTGLLNDAERYDPATNQWSAGGEFIAARYSHSATLLADGKVLVAGGNYGGAIHNVQDASVYDPGTNTWASTGQLVTARACHAATLLPDGRVLIYGGERRYVPWMNITLIQTARAPLAAPEYWK